MGRALVKDANRIAELGAALITGAVLLIAVVVLSVFGQSGSDDRPLNTGEASSDTGSATQAPNPQAADVYATATPCDTFSEPFAKAIPNLNEHLPTPQRIGNDTTATCKFDLREGTLTITTIRYLAEDGMPGHQRAAQALAAGGGTALENPRIADESITRACIDESSCGLGIRHQNMVVEFSLAITNASKRGSLHDTLVRIAGDYAATNLTK